MSIILVSGGNRGIGMETVRQLDLKGHTVIMGSRIVENAKPAFDNVIVKQLDVTSHQSISNLVTSVKEEYGRLDILINNAAIGEIARDDSTSFARKVKNSLEERSGLVRKINKRIIPQLKSSGIISSRGGITKVPESDIKTIMDTNFYGPLRLITACLPLLESGDDPQIINVSSGMGLYSNLTGEYPAYSLSKSALNALTVMLSNELAEKNIRVNAVCPGWVKTELGGVNAPLTVEQGADTIVWLADNNIDESGKFFKNREIIEW